jgi:hypothetical protein
MMLPITTVWWIVGAGSIVTFIISWLLFCKIKLNNGTFKTVCHWIELRLENCEDWFTGHWYTLLLMVCTVFVFWHFEKCLDLKFSADFNGYNTIFIFWLILLIIPLFEKFEVSGLSIKTRKQARALDASFEAAIKASDSAQTLNADQLEELHKNGGKDE